MTTRNFVKSKAGKLGAFARYAKYGNPGTVLGRKKGGLASLATHRKIKSGFKILREIHFFRKTEELAELLGLLVGDGHLSQYQVSLSTNSITDRDHAAFVRTLFEKVTSVPVIMTTLRSENTITLVASSKALVTRLNNLGMPLGNKIASGLRIPLWVKANRKFAGAFIRGLFDSDGSVFLDRHLIKGKRYESIGWTITSKSPSLLVDMVELLRCLDFSPTHRESQWAVYLRKKENIIRFFREIKTHNPKHEKRYQDLIGRVPKR